MMSKMARAFKELAIHGALVVEEEIIKISHYLLLLSV